MIDIHDPAYEPFIRCDQYGHLGLAPQPLWEQARLIALSVTLLPLKLFGGISCLVSFYLICRVSVLLPKRYRDELVPRTGKFFCRLLLLCIGFAHVRWIQVAEQQKNARQPATNGQIDRSAPAVGIVSNHVGWSDILLHMAKYFPSFVARKETQDLSMVGLIR